MGMEEWGGGEWGAAGEVWGVESGGEWGRAGGGAEKRGTREGGEGRQPRDMTASHGAPSSDQGSGQGKARTYRTVAPSQLRYHGLATDTAAAANPTQPTKPHPSMCAAPRPDPHRLVLSAPTDGGVPPCRAPVPPPPFPRAIPCYCSPHRSTAAHHAPHRRARR